MNTLIFDTLVEVLSTTLGDTLVSLVSEESELLELACFVTKFTAKDQILHSDTVFSSQPVTYTTTIALQDIHDDMGPTVFVSESFTEKFHENFEGKMTRRHKLIESKEIWRSTLSSGCGACYDSRIHHAGSANRSTLTRRLFYFSFSCPMGIKTTDPENFSDFWNVASIRDEIKGKYKLKDFRKHRNI